MNQILNSSVSTALRVPDSASGPLPYTLLNDYLFKALLQENNLVLKGLISSLLHLPLEEIRSVTITNPIELGKAVTAKTFLLDVRVLFNDSTLINLGLR